jgi:hypothetical protein
MTRRVCAAVVLIFVAIACVAASQPDQLGPAAWRVLKTMMGTSTCATGSLCMWGGGTYYADSITEAQDAIDNGCGDDLTVTTGNLTGCHIFLTKGVMDNGGVTLHLAGTGTPQTGRAGITLSGVGGGTATGLDGYETAGTIIKSSGSAAASIDVGTCQGCTIENITIAGEDISTAGISILSPTSSSYPTTRLVIRNVAMYEINGFGIKTGTTGQVDTMLFENVSVRDSDGCYQQNDNQIVGVILTNFDCSLATSTSPVFDIVEGDFTLLNSYVGVKNNGVGVRFGLAAARAIIRGNQLEFGTSTSAVMFDFDEGDGGTESNLIFDSNHVAYNQSGNVLFDVRRKGSLTISNNSWQDTAGGKTLTSDIRVDNGSSSADNRLYTTLIGNISASAGSGGVLRPVRWIPTLTANATGLLPTLAFPVISSPVTPGACMDGELWNDNDAVAGSNSLTKCLGGAWVAL